MKSNQSIMFLTSITVLVIVIIMVSILTKKKENYMTFKRKVLENGPIITEDETPREDLYVDNDLFTGTELKPEDVVYIKSNYSYNRVLFPKLKKISKMHVGYVCRINGYIPDALKLYELKMKDEVRDKLYIRYQIIDDVGTMSYSSLYEIDNPLKKGYYVYFSNGKQYQVTSMEHHVKPKRCSRIKIIR